MLKNYDLVLTHTRIHLVDTHYRWIAAPFSLSPPSQSFCYCVFVEILNRREEREKTCDLCSTVFPYPKSWAWETTGVPRKLTP
jgi:hypothetical protein